jgi:hypothetical protein
MLRFVAQGLKTLHSIIANLAILVRLQNGAAGFLLVLAVAEFAVANKRMQFNKTGQNLVSAHVPEAKFANAGGVDEMATFRKVKQLGGGGRVRAFLVGFGNLPDL